MTRREGCFRAAVAAGLAVAVSTADPARAEPIAIEGATVHVRPGERLDGATVVLDGGRITAVGAGIPVPANARRINGRDKVVTAGFVDAYTRLGLIEVNAVDSTSDGEFPEGYDTAIHAAYRAIDGYNPGSVAIPVARANGVTSAIAAPDGGLVSGQSAWVSLGNGAFQADSIVRAPAAMHVTLGEDAGKVAHGSRGFAVERLRELLDDAAQYAKRKNSFERNQTRPFAAGRLDLEALGPVVSGALPLMVSVHRAADIEAALRVAGEYNVKLIVAGGTEAWRVADALAAAKVPVILDPTDNLPGDFDKLLVRDDAAAVLRRAGVSVIVSTILSQTNVGGLRQMAGIAVANGMTWDDALASVTTAPAAALGVTDRGTVTRGAVADVVVWSGDPFELSSRPVHVIVGGIDQPLATRQTRLLERYRTLPGR